MQEVVGSTPIFSTKAYLVSLFYAFYVYILYSLTIDQYYIGHSYDIEERLFRHTNSGSKATKKANDWKLVYKEEFELRAEAYSREASGKSFHNLIHLFKKT